MHLHSMQGLISVCDMGWASTMCGLKLNSCHKGKDAYACESKGILGVHAFACLNRHSLLLHVSELVKMGSFTHRKVAARRGRGWRP